MSDAARAAPPPHDWTPAEPPLALAGIAYFAPLYEYAVLADRKASFFMSAGGLMLTVLGFFIGRIVARARPRTAGCAWAFGAVLVDGRRARVVAGVIVVRRVRPAAPADAAVARRVPRHRRAARPRSTRATSCALSHAQAFTDMLHYNHVVAAWAAGKFRLVNRRWRCSASRSRCGCSCCSCSRFRADEIRRDGTLRGRIATDRTCAGA